MDNYFLTFSGSKDKSHGNSCSKKNSKLSSVTISLHTNTSEFVVCIYGSDIERFHDEQDNETEIVVMKAERDIF